MRFTVNRDIIIEYIDSIEELSLIILYSLIVSHGIRVDTRLWFIKNHKTVYMLEGYGLRHLYPHEKSLKGFIRKIVSKNKIIPGTKLYPYTIFKERFTDADLIIVNERINHLFYSVSIPSKNPPIHIRTRYNIIITTSKILNHLKEYSKQTIFISEKYIPLFIIKSHYFIDTIIGGWVRRYGEIKYFKPII